MSRPSEAPLSRITVDTEADWLNIRNNVDKAMMRQMDARLATLPGGKDGEASRTVKKQVESRLKKIQEDMFELAKPNLRINGHNYESFIAATESWDEALDIKVWSLAREKEGWDSKIANQRKTVPRQVRDIEINLEIRKAAVEYIPEGEDDEDQAMNLDEAIPPPARHEEVKKTFDQAISNISDLSQTAATELQRAQRAQSVREEISNIPR